MMDEDMSAHFASVAFVDLAGFSAITDVLYAVLDPRVRLTG